MAADGGCKRDAVRRITEGYRAWGALKSVLNNKSVYTNSTNCVVLS